MSPRLTAYLLMILATMIWGVAGPVIKYSLNFIGPFNFLFWRLLIASIATLPIFIWYIKKHPLPKNFLLRLIFLGLLCTTLNLSLVFLGLKYTSVINATILGSLGPIFVVIASHFFLKEPLPARKRVGLVFVFAGSTVTILQPLISGVNKQSESMLLGNILILLGILVWVVFVLLSKKWEHETLKPFHITAISFFVGPITFLPLALMENNFSLQSPIPVWPFLVYCAIFSSLVAYTAYALALSKIQASETEIFNYLAPLWSTPLAILWLGETFNPALIVSAVLIFIGILLVEYRKNLFVSLWQHNFIHHR